MVALLLVAGCVVGPTYRTPELSAPPTWQTGSTGGVKSVAKAPADSARWWRGLNDPLLSTLVEEAAANNLDLKQAQARLRESRARRGLSRAELYPSVQAGLGSDHSRSSGKTGAGGGRVTDTFSAQWEASFDPDLFGAKRRALEAAGATVEASQEDLGDVLVSLVAEVALNYIELRGYQARLAIYNDTLAAQQESWRIAQWRRQAGLTTQLDEDQARFNLEQTRSQIPALRTGAQQAKNRLAVLVGRQPGSLAQLDAAAAIPGIPAEIAIAVPAETLRQRPDIRRAERKLAAATAEVGVAEAARYPSLTLSGTLGLQATSLGNLPQPGAYLYSLAQNAIVTVFDGGRLRQNVEIQNALRQEALLTYRSSVLGAVRDVENALVAYAEEQNRRQALRDAVQAAQSAVGLATGQYASGLIDFSTVLDSERSLLSLRDQLVQSEAGVSSNLARLYKSVGGGWDRDRAGLAAPPSTASGDKQ